jgi:ATP-dependent DNA helicase Rep
LVSERKNLLEVAQTISLLSTLSERETDQNVVTLSTLHAAKGLEWPHVMLVGVNEGLLPFRQDTPVVEGVLTESQAIHLQEERRLMYVGITRAQHTLAVSWARKRKKGRDAIAKARARTECQPSSLFRAACRFLDLAAPADANGHSRSTAISTALLTHDTRVTR